MENHLERSARARCAGWVLTAAADYADADLIVGDLEEECALIGDRCTVWYWSQVIRSLPFLAWSSIIRDGVFRAVAVVGVLCALQAGFEVLGHIGISSMVAPDNPLVMPLMLGAGLVTLPIIGYIASRIHPPSAILLPMVLAAAVLALSVRDHSVPLWYRLLVLALAPSAALAGRLEHVRRASLGPPFIRKTG